MKQTITLLALMIVVAGAAAAFAAAAPAEPLTPSATADRGAWFSAGQLKKPMTADEARAFMKRLAQFVYDNHLKKDSKSPQRGMTYEYLDVSRKGQPDQWVQGEALDTMHDGAWLAIALVNAYRATGDPFYKEWLTDYTLPFYLKMLNHSDTFFTKKVIHVAPKGNAFNKEHALQPGEKGFVPYWWDDGASISLGIIQGADEKQPPAAVITLVKTKDGSLRPIARNAAGEALEATTMISRRGNGTPTYFLRIPYTVVGHKAGWMNVVEWGQFTVKAGERSRGVIVRSAQTSVATVLQQELAGGLRTWEAIFDEYGFIPTGMGSNAEKDRFSDTGGYAHLISATAEYLFLLEGKKDWEAQRIPPAPQR